MAEPAVADPRVARARAGDELALTELYDEYAPRVYRFLLQRVFLKVVEALPGFEERACHSGHGSSGSHGTRRSTSSVPGEAAPPWTS